MSAAPDPSPDPSPAAGGRPVAVAVSGVDDDAALAYAVAQARARATTLRLVHVAPGYVPVPMLPVAPEALSDVGRRLLTQAAQAAHALDPELPVERVLRTGSRAVELGEESHGDQLLVVGRRRHGGLPARICARAACPVVVVPRSWRGAPDGPPRVVVGVRTGTPGGAALAAAFAQAAALGATVEAVHAWHVADPYADLVHERTWVAEWTALSTELVEQALVEARAAHPEVSVEVRILHGRPVPVLEEVSRDAALLVLQRRRHLLLPHGHLGWTGRSLVASSPVPVMVLPVSGPAGGVTDGR